MYDYWWCDPYHMKSPNYEGKKKKNNIALSRKSSSISDRNMITGNLEVCPIYFNLFHLLSTVPNRNDQALKISHLPN